MRQLARYDLGNHLSTRIVDAARIALDCLGPGLLEKAYRHSVAKTLRRQSLDVQELFPVDAWQSGELARLYFLDLLIDWQVVVDVRVLQQPIPPDYRDEMRLALEVTGAPLGLLLNFGRDRLEFERIFL
jgi:iron complex transport system substrate-binding protein